MSKLAQDTRLAVEMHTNSALADRRTVSINLGVLRELMAVVDAYDLPGGERVTEDRVREIIREEIIENLSISATHFGPGQTRVNSFWGNENIYRTKMAR